MSHHFDSVESRRDSRINICDIYLFAADDPAKIVAIMTVSPLAGLASPFTGERQADTFRPGCGYEFRFDTNRDGVADVVFRFVFEGAEVPQRWRLYRLANEAAHNRFRTGSELAAGAVEEIVETADGFRLWAGLAGDPFFLDAVAARGFLDKFRNGEFDRPAFSTGASTTGATNVLAIAAEIPRRSIGAGRFDFFATVSADDHGHWTQVNRCGNPNFAATFNDHPVGALTYNSTDPATDYENFAAQVIQLVAQGCRLAGSAPEPEKYGELVARWFLPDMIPFDPQLPSCYGFAAINGRRLEDDFGTVVYTKIFNTPLVNLAPPPADLRAEFPFVPPPRPLPAETAPVEVPGRVEG